MDHRGKTLLGIFAFAATSLSVAAFAAEKPVLRAMAWLAPEGQLDALTTEPATSFRINSNLLAQSDMILVGEALFHAPTLLGGQAAKAGISCASCHTNGRGNPHFRFPGVSGKRGTADVTHSFFSSHRGDAEFNPVPIPDLAKTGKISRQEPGKLENFIRGLIVEEFDGAEPSAATLRTISIYVRALCDDCTQRTEKINLDTHWKRTERSVVTAEKFEKTQPDLSYLLLSSARHQLGLVHERFNGPELSKQRQMLVKLSAKVLQLQDAIGGGRKNYSKLSGKVMDQMAEVEEKLIKSEAQSLYNPELLAQILKR